MNRSILTLISFLALFSLETEAANFFDEAEEFFSEHVNSKGLVNYKAIKNKPENLNSLVAMIGVADLESMEGNEKKAFLINSYNILVIKGIINNYPTSSPLDIDGFFKKIEYKVGGEQLTLSDLENEVIMSEFPDSRLHFALVCAAKGCPPLKSDAYLPEKLENQLEASTEFAVNNKEFVSTTSFPALAKLSKIFEWYADDFKSEGGSVLGFINEYREEQIPKTHKMVYLDYDWSLNAQ